MNLLMENTLEINGSPKHTDLRHARRHSKSIDHQSLSPYFFFFNGINAFRVEIQYTRKTLEVNRSPEHTYITRACTPKTLEINRSPEVGGGYNNFFRVWRKIVPLTMLQWIGGSRRQVTASRKSTQKRQKQYFEQRKRQQQQQTTGLESYSDGMNTCSQHQTNNRSLDVLSLLNLSTNVQSSCTSG
ncbi:hypothetical protein F0562_035144 [Nyssa sinensis]|uniref:Uncharacterized protein n=1 Tax=Nyssa sinensis TaxID=561372 RepID=A0A5J5AEW3_9ASTE|nr:hypothetical protein F0562_035144 [Nyssa sinensis]